MQLRQLVPSPLGRPTEVLTGSASVPCASSRCDRCLPPPWVAAGLERASTSSLVPYHVTPWDTRTSSTGAGFRQERAGTMATANRLVQKCWGRIVWCSLVTKCGQVTSPGWYGTSPRFSWPFPRHFFGAKGLLQTWPQGISRLSFFNAAEKKMSAVAHAFKS